MMMQTKTQRSYQMSAIQGASSIGLIIVLFDTLARDLRQAAAALRRNDIETRCRDLNHASLVLGQLENWLDPDKGGESAQTLTRFYAYLRAKMMEAAVSNSAALLETQIEMILHVRSAWQKLDSGPQEASSGPPAEALTQQTNTALTPMLETNVERIPFSQSG
jgi:flagellar secretion chaperone FliS